MKKRNKSILFSSLIVLAFLSAAVTSFVLFHQQRANEKASEQLMNHVKEADKGKKIISIKEIVEDIDEVYLESYLGSKDIVEINGHDIGELVARLKSLDFKLVMESNESIKNVEEYNNCLYAIHIKNKNIKIKVNERYIIIDNANEGTFIFEGEESQLKALNEKIEAIYMKKYNAFEVFKNPQNIYIAANDEEKQWVLNKKQIEQLLEKIHLVSPVDGNQMVGISVNYPDYMIKIEMPNKTFKIHLVNKEILLIDASDSYAYYRYDSELWKYIHKAYAVNFNVNQDPFKVLLKSKKIAVDDMENIFDFEDANYYNIELARGILKAKKKEMEEIPNDELLMYNLKFTVEGKNIEVKIFKNYIEYMGKNYHSEKIGEIMKSMLSV